MRRCDRFLDGFLMVALTVRGIRSPAVGSGREVHVLPHPDGWAVSRAKGNCRVFITRAYALTAAEAMAKRHHASVVVHDDDGVAEVVASYAKPPREVAVPGHVTLTAGH